MKIFTKILKTSKRIVGYQTHKQGFQIINDVVQQTRAAAKGEIAEDKQTEVPLSKTEKQNISKRLRLISVAFVVFAVIGIFTMVSFLMSAAYLSALMSLAFVALCAVLTFKYQFIAHNMVKSKVS